MAQTHHHPHLEDLQGEHVSYWMSSTHGQAPTYPALQGVVEADVAVVGAGIAGITAATELVEAGLDVVVLEKGQVASGTTSHSTAKLTSNHGLVYQDHVDNFGREHAAQYARANQHAIDFVGSQCRTRGIDAGFERTHATTYTDQVSDVGRVEREVEVAQDLGLPAELVDDVPLNVDCDAGIRYTSQAQFHPRRYLLGLLEDLGSRLRVYEGTRATDLDQEDGDQVVETKQGTVRADDVVVATHFPFHDPGMYFARMEPRYSYLLAVELSTPAPEGMYYRAGEPYFTFRAHPDGERNMAVVGGHHHRTGHGQDARTIVQGLQKEAKQVLPVESVRNRWGTQDYFSADGIPLVGPIRPGREHVYVATGFGGWGLSNGTAAGLLLSDLVLNRESPWEDVYDPSRFKLGASAKLLWDHNKHAGQHLIEDKLAWWQQRGGGEIIELQPGEAKVVDTDDGPVAAYRDEDGSLYAVDATCRHMGCHVNWNDAEESWDCPCHGSRYDVDGTLIDGPAVEDLPQRDVDLEGAEPDLGAEQEGLAR